MAREVSRRIALDRRVCVVRQGYVEVRPERGAVIAPVIGLALSAGLIVAVGAFANSLSVAALAAMLIPAVIIAPFSAMGVVYSLMGTHVAINAQKQSARFQQGMLGLGLGTAELVPFWKIDHIEVADPPTEEEEEETPMGLPLPLEFRAWNIVLVKVSGKRLSMGQAVSANEPALIEEGFGRALDAAEAIAGLTGKPLTVTAALEETEVTEGAETAVEEAAAQVMEGDLREPLEDAF